MNNLLILLVDTEDWYGFGDDIEGYLKHAQSKVLDYSSIEEQELFKNNVRLWSNIVNSSYMNFRGKIKDIAISNHKRMGLEIHPAIFHKQMTRDQFALITDDDDFFNPELIDIVNLTFENNPDIEVVYWDSWQYKTVYLKEEFCIFDLHQVGSNSFAIRGGNSHWLYTWGAHNKINDWIPPEKKVFIPNKALSLWNIHPASFWQRTHYEILKDFYKLNRSLKPEILNWANDDIDLIYKSITELVPKA